MKLPKPLQYIWSGWCYVWLILVTGPCAAAVLILGKLGLGADRMHRIARFWARSLLRGIGVTVLVHGQENLTPGAVSVFASNHTSALDIPALLAVLPDNFRWMAKKELFSIFLFGPAMLQAGYIPIDRSSSRGGVRSLGEAARRIAAGASVVVFPEGTRSPNQELLPFKSGGLALAVKAAAPVVPTAIIGAREVLPPKAKLLNPGAVQVVFGEPVATLGFAFKERDRLAALVQERVAALLAQFRPG